ncbi:hypothetical protein OC842_003208, partial [Tilletia horrida]
PAWITMRSKFRVAAIPIASSNFVHQRNEEIVIEQKMFPHGVDSLAPDEALALWTRLQDSWAHILAAAVDTSAGRALQSLPLLQTMGEEFIGGAWNDSEPYTADSLYELIDALASLSTLRITLQSPPTPPYGQNRLNTHLSLSKLLGQSHLKLVEVMNPFATLDFDIEAILKRLDMLDASNVLRPVRGNQQGQVGAGPGLAHPEFLMSPVAQSL